MPDTMDEHLMALNGKLQALVAFEDAADIGATAHILGHTEEGHSLQMRFAKDVLSVISVLRPGKTLFYHTMVRIWSRSILERSCNLQLRRHSAMRTTEARISMTPSLVIV